VGAFRRRGRPQTEGAVDVDPGTGTVRGGYDRRCGIECAGIHVARLDTHDGSPAELGQCVGAHPSLLVSRDREDTIAAKPEQSEGLKEGGVRFRPHDDCDWWCAEHAVGLDVPARPDENRVASSSQRRKVGHRRAGHERACATGWQSKHI
jgi:hypothetical protein